MYDRVFHRNHDWSALDVVKKMKRILTIAAGIVLAWFIISMIRLLIYSVSGLIYWEWDFELWFSNEIHRIFDHFMYG